MSIMPEHQQTHQSTESKSTAQKQATFRIQAPVSHPMAIIQRARMNPKSLTHADVMQLQRTIGNRAVGRLLSEIGLIPSKAKQAPPVQRQELVQRQEIPEEEETCLSCVQRQEKPEEEEEPLQGKMIDTIQRQEIPEEEENPLQGVFESKLKQTSYPPCIQRKELEEEEPLQTKRENNTGMPDNLKAGVESLSGIDMSDVRVHYNSDKPAEVGALAYTQGSDIHVAPGQEKHLPHEVWHVVQQARDRVRPTIRLKGVAVNDDVVLEHEADVMGARSEALQEAQQGGHTDLAQMPSKFVPEQGNGTACEKLSTKMKYSTIPTSSDHANVSYLPAIQRSLLEKSDNSSREKKLKSIPEMDKKRQQSSPCIAPPVQRVILDENDKEISDEKLELMISGYSPEIQDIIMQLHLIEEAGWSLEQAVTIAKETLKEGEITPATTATGMDTGVPTPSPSPTCAALLGGDMECDDSGSDYVPGDCHLPPARSPARRGHKKTKQQGSFKTRKTFRGHPPRAVGDEVMVTREKVGHYAGEYRTTSVAATVRLTPTKGRPSAPEPDVGPKVGITWKEVGSRETRNTGIVDMQKGHLMALELGGPDIPENIVAQFAQFQSNGSWRQAEINIFKITEEENKKGNTVEYECIVKYKRYKYPEQGTIKGVFIPVAFKITIQRFDSSGGPIGDKETMFDSEQKQDKTDDKMGERAISKLESEDGSSESEDGSSESEGGSSESEGGSSESEGGSSESEGGSSESEGGSSESEGK
jgi:uncharacterized protein (DUF736 family)